jgi:hypothetical protein
VSEQFQNAEAAVRLIRMSSGALRLGQPYS